MSTLFNRICQFSSALEWSAIPEYTQKKARAQLLGWLGGVASGWVADEASGLWDVARTIGGSGQATVWPAVDEILSDTGAAYLNAALSCAFDFDDYLFLAHTGHSACGVPWSLAQSTDARLSDVLSAMVASNEIMGRLGASCVVGPQNGQLWTFIHLAGACIGACRIGGHDADVLSRALSIAFFQPPMALIPGFGQAEVKLLSAATPTLLGLMAVRHASSGLGGTADILEAPGGFFERFSFLPLTRFFDDLGETFVTDTISIKPVPGCAYVTAPVLGAIECVRQYAEQHQRPLSPDEIKRINVKAGPMTLAMQKILGDGQTKYNPVSINFNVCQSVAASVLHGRLDPEDLVQSSLSSHQRLLSQIEEKITLTSAPDLAADLVRAVGFKGRVWSNIRRAGLLQGLTGVARALGATVAKKDLSARRARFNRAELAALLSMAWSVMRSSGRRKATELGDGITFPFGASVSIQTTGGETYRSRCRVPEGAAGSGDDAIVEVAREKFLSRSARYAAPKVLEPIAEAILEGSADDRAVSELIGEMASSVRRRPGAVGVKRD